MHIICTSLDIRQGDMWSLGCALFKWTTGKEFAYLAAGARLQDVLHLVPPRFGNKVSLSLEPCHNNEGTFGPQKLP